MSLRGTSVLVTGADGFIGSHLVERLVAEGARVRAFCIYNSRGSAGWLDEAAAETRAALDIRLGDIRDARFVEAATEDVEIVFHLAALIAIPYSYVAAESFIDTNVRGTLNVLEAARRSGVAAGHRDLDERGVRHAGRAPDPRDPSAPGAVAVCRVEGGRRPAGDRVPPQPRVAGDGPAAVQHLRSAPVGAGRAPHDAPPAPRRTAARSSWADSTRAATSPSSPTRSTGSCAPRPRRASRGGPSSWAPGRTERIGDLFDIACELTGNHATRRRGARPPATGRVAR